ncbi:hypothetical protein CDO52_24815 [Nocardiopsis gilva YIM 90087]|uniref:Uncharacterized protein n=1 Tax=Nocardiopsis gilva YIM 90087 TaxID=1235441 RepID=A0A223SBQ3_9ACTN|nr:hypothetical protein [Nocardiopsis gilva]ASU85594.1 hypothetical protein CDO52_24815 [Nocardiopsis gilva YIM 90087]
MTNENDPLLRGHYGDRWAIRRTENLWVAVAHDPEADHAPTIVQPDINTFLSDLENPPPRAGHPRSLMSAEFFAARYEQVDDGVWRNNAPPEG